MHPFSFTPFAHPLPCRVSHGVCPLSMGSDSDYSMMEQKLPVWPRYCSGNTRNDALKRRRANLCNLRAKLKVRRLSQKLIPMGSSATEFRRVLDALESIRAVVGSAGELSLPQICVVGDQSSGKSTLLGSLVEGLNEVLPQGAGTCTLAPIVVALRRAREGEQPSITVGDQVSSWDEEGRHKAQEIIRELQKQGDFRQSIAVPAPSPPLDSPAGGDPSSDDIDIEAREVIVRVSHPEAVDLTVCSPCEAWRPCVCVTHCERERVV